MSDLIDSRMKVQDGRNPGGYCRGSKEMEEGKRTGRKVDDRKEGRRQERREKTGWKA